MEKMDLVVHNKASAYSPIMAQFVNLLQDTPDFQQASATPHEFLARVGAVGDVGVARYPSTLITEVREKRQKYSHLDEDTRRHVLIDLVRARGYRAEEAMDLVDNLHGQTTALDPAAIESLFARDNTSLRAAAFDFIELQEMTNEARTDATFLRRVPRLRSVYETAQRLGFRDVIHVERFPMALVHAGYRRHVDARQIQGATVNLHEPDRETGNYTVYAETFTTEALLFVLDPERVAAWAERWTRQELPYRELRKGFQVGCMARQHAQTLRECDDARGTGAPGALGHAAFTLLHSLSHAAIQAASTRSGFAANSLKEHLTPAPMAFAVTVNKNYEESLGGLDALFNNDLDDLFERMELGTVDCLQDPICQEGTEGACYACLHLSETSCAHYNSHLARRVLHGDLQRQRPGFWQP